MARNCGGLDPLEGAIGTKKKEGGRREEQVCVLKANFASHLSVVGSGRQAQRIEERFFGRYTAIDNLCMALIPANSWTSLGAAFGPFAIYIHQACQFDTGESITSVRLSAMLLLLATIVVDGRPEGNARKSEVRGVKRAQTLDPASLPKLNDKDENNLKREAKESQTLINGGIIPVKLIYGSNDEETFVTAIQNEVLKNLLSSGFPPIRRSDISENLQFTYPYQNNFGRRLQRLSRTGSAGAPLWRIIQFSPHSTFPGKAKSRTKRGIAQGIKEGIKQGIKQGIKLGVKEGQPSPPWVEPELGPSNAGNSGPQIMRLKVRNGGVAIAGPGGIATAGSGGTAIVGPGGTAYTSSDGIAVVGPGGKLIHVPNANFKTTPVVMARTGSTMSTRQKLASAKVVATGPVVYYPGAERL
ncbi:hypothetical protein AAG570_008755 [Ranatra chinensis]|uniref:DUF4774 domain-containing protein n=1 Tax=Ranatra chinensis TaxID=642074 RepID=A0ABD0YRS9_9HEMI